MSTDAGTAARGGAEEREMTIAEAVVELGDLYERSVSHNAAGMTAEEVRAMSMALGDVFEALESGVARLRAIVGDGAGDEAETPGGDG